MADFKTITLEHDEIPLDIEYVFEGIENRIQILSINKIPQYFFSKGLINDLYFALGEAMIQESFEKKEYLEEIRGDENRGN